MEPTISILQLSQAAVTENRLMPGYEGLRLMKMAVDLYPSFYIAVIASNTKTANNCPYSSPRPYLHIRSPAKTQ